MYLNHVAEKETMCKDVDDSFGPWAGDGCRGGFDFTLLFEESILTIPLQALLLLAFPILIAKIIKEPVKVAPNILRHMKAIASVSLVALNTALLGLWISSSFGINRTRATIPTAALTLISSLSFCVLSRLEHDRSIRPSFAIFTYLFLSILFDAARARTLWMLLVDNQAIPAVLTTSLALRAVMLVLESIEKRPWLLGPYRGCSREDASSPFSRSLFYWLIPLFRKGYTRILTLQDLDPLSEELRSEKLRKVLLDAWEKVPNKTMPGALLLAWMRSFTMPVLTAVIPRLCLTGFNYAQPFLITAGIDLASSPREPKYNNVGYGLTGAYIIVYAGIAISTGQYEWHAYRTASMIRGSVIGLVYQKVLRLDIATTNENSKSAMTLVTTDIETIVRGAAKWHELWAGLLEIAIGIYLIWRQLGAACAIPVALVFAGIIATVFIAIPTGIAQAAWIHASQERVTATSKILGAIKWLKISGLTNNAFETIRKLRRRELSMSLRYRRLLGVTLMLMACIPIWIPILTFSTFAGISAGDSNTTLNVQKAFTSLALFVLLTGPLSNIILTLSEVTSIVTSFQRIQNYLNTVERSDNRITTQDSSRETRGGSTKSLLSAESQSGSPPYQNQESLEMDLIGANSGSLEKDEVASVQGQFSWEENATAVIDIEKQWTIRRQTLTIIVGPTGSGKSTLLLSLLGELSTFKGRIHTNYSSVAYCTQTAWLPNDTVRNIIVGPNKFDKSWYSIVIKACALEADFNSWPAGDQTSAGTNGISLSGGQKHRIALSRAIYSKKELIILDDVFGGLDSNTEDLIFDNLFNDGGICRSAGMTVIITASDARRVSHADQVLMLDMNGHITYNGAPEIVSSRPQVAENEVEQPPSDGHNLLHKSDTEAMEVAESPVKPSTDSKRQRGDWRLYNFYGSAIGWVTFSIFMISMAIFAFFNSFPSIWLNWWAEANAESPNKDLGKWLGVYVALGVGAVVTILLSAWQLFIVVINKSGVYFHDLLSNSVSKAPMSFHNTVDVGITINRFSQDLQLIDMVVPASTFGVATSIAIGFAEVIVICVAARFVAVALPFLILIAYAIQHFYLRTSRQVRLLDIEHKAPLYTQLMSTLDGLATIRAFQWQNSFDQATIRLLDESQRPNYLLFCIQRWLTLSIDMVIMVIAVILILLVTNLREQLGAGFIGIALSNVLGLSTIVKEIIESWIILETAIGAVARVRSFSLETKTEDDETKGQLPAPTIEEWPTHGAIQIDSVTAAYALPDTVLKSITLSIQPGQRVSICGRTGSGKSSLALCLLRMINQVEGTITIDGRDIQTIPHELVRSRLVAVPQEPYIFDNNVRYNVDPSGNVSDEEIVRALERVQLWDRIEKRGGLDAAISEKVLSQGEAQLLVFARAMLCQGKILILDEFTSSMDDEMSSIIYQILDSWFQGWTIIVITHRVDQILDFDKVALLEFGKLLEYDEPRKLLEQDSSFKKLYDLSCLQPEDSSAPEV